jgi:DnaJ-class molecular chaperone
MSAAHDKPLREPCGDCDGNGNFGPSPCDTCNGLGYTTVTPEETAIVETALRVYSGWTEAEIQKYIAAKLAATEGLTRTKLYLSLHNSSTFGPILARLKRARPRPSCTIAGGVGSKTYSQSTQ